jgi:hypothetical protein
LFLFVEGDVSDLELRKLPALIPDIKVNYLVLPITDPGGSNPHPIWTIHEYG